MAQYPFLSEEWIAETRRIREEHKDQAPAMPVAIRMNMVIRDVPFGDGSTQAYVDTSSGLLDLEYGALDKPDLTVTLSYDTAKAMLVDGDAGKAMNAFMSGRIKVEGDITKLLALQSAGAGQADSAAATEVVKKIQDITAG
jgi:putative sterol carrier protein